MKSLNKTLGNAKSKAAALLGDRDKTVRLLDASRHLLSRGVDPLDTKGLSGRVLALIRMVRCWVNREYKEVPWQTLVLVTAGLIYLVTPLDGIPDLLPLIGFSDDIAVLSAVIVSVSRDLEKFLEWEKSSMAQADVVEPEPEEPA
ncbi:MAG: DUF1232 domain-containing protein [Chlorobiaceae bacterium]|nr:DUF1232 domain-containing protein [Chlorobiaceae bacterium]